MSMDGQLANYCLALLCLQRGVKQGFSVTKDQTALATI